MVGESWAKRTLSLNNKACVIGSTRASCARQFQIRISWAFGEWILRRHYAYANIFLPDAKRFPPWSRSDGSRPWWSSLKAALLLYEEHYSLALILTTSNIFRAVTNRQWKTQCVRRARIGKRLASCNERKWDQLLGMALMIVYYRNIPWTADQYECPQASPKKNS